MSRYAIWDGVSPVYTYGPPYEFTAEQWLAKYPWAKRTPAVIGGGTINGAVCNPLEDMVTTAAAMGADFSECTTDEEKLAVIVAWEDAQAAAAAEAAALETLNAERQTAALEAIADGQTTENAAALDALLTGVA